MNINPKKVCQPRNKSTNRKMCQKVEMGGTNLDKFGITTHL